MTSLAVLAPAPNPPAPIAHQGLTLRPRRWDARLRHPSGGASL